MTDKNKKAKYIFRDYPDKYNDFEEFRQSEEFVKEINATIKESAKALTSKTRSSSASSSNSSSGIRIEYTQEQRDTTKMIVAGILCFLFPPFGIYILIMSINRHREEAKRKSLDDYGPMISSKK